MKKTGLLFAVLLSFLTVCATAFAGKGDFGLAKINGTVNTQEIGGQALYVFSMWNSGRKAFVESDGSFSVFVLSSDRPQKLSVRDTSEKTRGLAFVLSSGTEPITFDAASTARAMLLNDPALLKDAATLKKYSSAISSQRSFQAFVEFLKTNLPLKSLEALTRDDRYVVLFEACNKEIFSEDRKAIDRSLSEAEHSLKKIIREQ